MSRKPPPAARTWLLSCLLALALAPALRAAESTQDADLSSIDPTNHIEYLSTHGSRFTGYPGCAAAEKYIVGQFRSIGLANIEESPFQVTVPIMPENDRWGKRVPPEQEGHRPDHGGTLTVNGTEIPLYCVMPNYARTPMTGEKGVTGNLVWAGGGYLADFNGKSIQGSIVVMEFNSFSRWLNAAKLGAKAIIFLEPDHPFRNDAELKYNELPIPVPRYYLRRADLPALAAALQGKRPADYDLAAALKALDGLGTTPAEANVRAMMRWEEATVMRVSGEIPGTDPQLAAQTLVVFAYYDSVSVVPALSPGAESACGVASLIEAAKYLKAHPPRRKVKFIAAPGHFEALAGVRDYAFKTVYPLRDGANSTAGEGTGEPYFFIGLDISSRHNSLGSFYKGNFYDQLTLSWQNNEVELQRCYSEYSGVLVDWMDGLTMKGRPASGLTFQSGIVPQQGRDWRSLLPDLMAFDSEVLTYCGYPAITLATTGDPRNSVDTPLDTFEDMKPFLDNVRRQAISCAYLIKQTADIPVLPVVRTDVWKNRQVASIFGFAIELALQAYMPKVPLPNAVAAVSMLAPDLTTRNKSMMGVNTYAYFLSNVQGLFEVFGLANTKNYKVDGFLLSPTNGVPTKIAQSQLVAASNRARLTDWSQRTTDLRLNFFRAVSSTIFGLTDPLSLQTLGQTTAREGESNSELQYLVSFVGQGDNPAAVFFTERDRNVKFLLAYSAVGYEGLLINFNRQAEGAANTKREETGLGYRATDNENFVYDTGLMAARDMHDLDGYRLDRLASAGVTKSGDRQVYEQAGTYVDAARRSANLREYDASGFNTNMAWGLEGRIYPDIRDSRTDVVKGVIFYFALLLPFVIFAERLLINYVEIRHKLVAIGVLFVISYLVLRVVHPAFHLSQTPIIILIGFFMLVASIGTVWYLLGKFGIVMESVRQKVDMIHRADVARASATMAAFVLGISNMRKRKVRTGLTAVTLILLTFTILSFTSFETVPARMLEYSSSRTAPYVGVLLRGLGWGPLSEFVTYDMMNFFDVQGMQAARRSWFVNRKPTEELQIEVNRENMPGAQAVANAILGLDPQEQSFSGINDEKYYQGVWFDAKMADWPFVCILPSRMKQNLRIEDSDIGKAYISVLGRRLRVVGTFRSDEVFKFQDMDREEITPVDFVAQQYKQAGAGAAQAGGGLALSATGQLDVDTFVHQKSAKQEEEEQYIHMEPDRVLVVPNELNLELGGQVRSIAAGPGVSSQAEKVLHPFQGILKELLSRVNLALYAGYSDTSDGKALVHRVATRSRLSMGGVQGLLVPILIAALIVFNTMLGAVYERMYEIKTYASVGLAPMHIAALFFAESSVFAVMGAMLGYLIGQIISRGLMLVPGLMQGMTLNYSSISAVWSALLVVVVVLASTAYPARMAGKLSVPDETRKMAIPRPTSDVWEIWFPFTVSSKEALGVMSYLRDYFESNDEDAVGSFTSDNLRFYTEEVEARRRVCLDADVWVAPLDMGVSQAVKISAIPDPEEGEITYLFFTITRKSGEFQTWHRMNLGFLKDLRKQLLIWRLVTPEAKKRLTTEGAELLEQETAQAAQA
jgi:hypothetical protein